MAIRRRNQLLTSRRSNAADASKKGTTQASVTMHATSKAAKQSPPRKINREQHYLPMVSTTRTSSTISRNTPRNFSLSTWPSRMSQTLELQCRLEAMVVCQRAGYSLTTSRLSMSSATRVYSRIFANTETAWTSTVTPG